MALASLQPGDPARVGRYRLTARLGSGGMGVVYLGVANDGSQVAVKVLRPEMASDPEFRARFSREVTTLTRVKGMCTVRVIEADTQAARPFLVTEYIDGPAPSDYIEQHGALGPDMLYGLATGLAEALASIHAVAASDIFSWAVTIAYAAAGRGRPVSGRPGVDPAQRVRAVHVHQHQGRAAEQRALP